MKKIKSYLAACILVLLSFVAWADAGVIPEFVIVDSVNDAGTSYADGVNFYLPAGVYKLSPHSGAWNAWGEFVVDISDDGDLSNDRGYMWNMFIYQEPTATKYQLGDWTKKYASPADALSAYASQSVVFDQPTGGYVHFFIEDGYPSDNWGSVTARLDVIPEPASLILWGLGLSGLLFRRKRAV